MSDPTPDDDDIEALHREMRDEMSDQECMRARMHWLRNHVPLKEVDQSLDRIHDLVAGLYNWPEPSRYIGLFVGEVDDVCEDVQDEVKDVRRQLKELREQLLTLKSCIVTMFPEGER